MLWKIAQPYSQGWAGGQLNMVYHPCKYQNNYLNLYQVHSSGTTIMIFKVKSQKINQISSFSFVFEQLIYNPSIKK